MTQIMGVWYVFLGNTPPDVKWLPVAAKDDNHTAFLKDKLLLDPMPNDLFNFDELKSLGFKSVWWPYDQWRAMQDDIADTFYAEEEQRYATERQRNIEKRRKKEHAQKRGQTQHAKHGSRNGATTCGAASR